MGCVGENCGLQKSFELILDEGCGLHISGCFALKVKIATATEENTVVDVTEIVVSTVEVECALEGEVGDWFGDQDLRPGGVDIKIGQELASKSVGAND